MAESPEQYSELVGVLIRQQVAFWRAMAGVRARLVLNGLGLGQVDVRPLITALDTMRLEIEHSVEMVSVSA